MGKTRKRALLSTLLAVVLTLGLMPSFAFAGEGEGVSCPGGESCSHVAAMGGIHYSTLASAIESVQDEGTIQLVDDVDCSADGVTVAVGKNVTLDLNGYELTVANSASGRISVYGSLTIKDSTDTAKNGSGEGKILTDTDYVKDASDGFLVVADGENALVTLESGYINTVRENPVSNGQFALGVLDGGDLVVAGGKVEAGWYAVSGNGTNDTQDSKINITGGELVSTADYAVYLPQSGTTTISGGTIAGAAGGVSMQRGTLSISDDAFITSKGTGDTGNWGDGTGGQDCAALNVNAKYGDCNVFISGGKLTAEKDAVVIATGSTNETNVSITGGKFSSDVSEYLVDGYICVSADGLYEVAPLSEDNAVAKINSTYYETLSEAIASAQDGDTVTLLKDAAHNARISIVENVVLDLGGNVLTSETPHSFVVNPGISFTVKNGTINNSIGTAIYGLTDSAITVESDAVLNVLDGICATNNNADEGRATINVYGTINSTDIAVWGQGPKNSITLDGATITANYFAVYQNGSFGGNSYTIKNSTIYNGEDAGPAIYISNNKTNAENENQGWQTLTVENSTIIGSAGIEVKYTNVEVSKSTVIATAAEPTFDQYNNGSTTAGFAIVASDNTMEPDAPAPEGKIKINGGYYKGLVGLSSLIGETDYPSFKEATYTISDGYFTSDPSAYVAEGKVALPSDVAGYAFMVGEAPENAVAEPATGDPVVSKESLPSDMPETDKDAVMGAAASVKDGGELAAAANQAIELVTEQQKTDAEKAIGEADSGVAVGDQTVAIYAQAYLDITPTEYDSAGKTMTLDITPMYRVVASTATSAKDIDLEGADKNAVVLAGSEKELTNIKTMTLGITLPSGFAGDVTTLYVEHQKSASRSYFYTGAVASSVLTFTNPNGFSLFTISATNGAAAEIDGVGYATLQQAVDEVEDGQTIRLEKDNAENVVVNRAVSFALSENGKNFTGSIAAGSGYAMSEENGVYTFTFTGGTGGGGVPIPDQYEVTVGDFSHGKVTSNVEKAEEGDKVTLTVVPDAGFELETIAVVGPDGQEVELSANADGTYSFEMPGFDVEVEASFACDGGELCPSHGFADVDQGEWYHDAIDWAVSNGVLNGFDGTGLMVPDGEVTRAQMAQILWNVEGRPAVAEDPGFSDVADSDWFDGAVAWAASEGIFEGYDGTDSFGPDDVLTREQAAAVLMRWTEANGGDVDARADLSGYPDASSVDGWAVEYVSWAVASGVISGVEQEDGTLLLDPLGTATRAQTAMLMMRLVG